MREDPKAILLPRSSNPTRDSYLLVARPEGCCPLAVYQCLLKDSDTHLEHVLFPVVMADSEPIYWNARKFPSKKIVATVFFCHFYSSNCQAM